jgi:ferredoxin
MKHSTDSAMQEVPPQPLLTVTIEPFGWQFATDGTLALLEAARRAGFVLASSCRNGTCRACLCQLRSGEIGYRIEWPGVSADERKTGWILPCVASALSSLSIAAPTATKLPAAI